MSLIRVACETAGGKPFELPESFFGLPPDEVLSGLRVPFVSICREGIAALFAVSPKNDPHTFKFVFRDGPHPEGISPPPDAPSINDESARLMAKAQEMMRMLKGG